MLFWASMKRQRCSGSRGLRITLLGIGAMNSPRYRRAGLLVESGNRRIMIDGGPGAITRGKVDAWLVSDERCELMSDIRTLASDKGTKPRIGDYRSAGVSIVPKPVVHTSHPTYGYLIVAGRSHIVWAPEFFEISAWAANADLIFADAAGWSRPIPFAKGQAAMPPYSMEFLEFLYASRRRQRVRPACPTRLSSVWWFLHQRHLPIPRPLVRVATILPAHGSVGERTSSKPFAKFFEAEHAGGERNDEQPHRAHNR